MSSDGKRRQKWRGVIVSSLALVVLGLIGLAWWHYFGDTVWDNPEIGVCRFKLRWGKAYEVRIDTNRDGVADIRIRYSGLRTWGPHERPLESWEDTDYDGRVDLHSVWLNADGEGVLVLQVDDDGDGVYDRVLCGTDATQLYRERGFPGFRSRDTIKRLFEEGGNRPRTR
jgi:hypothetical protein